MDPDPAIFDNDLRDANKKLKFLKKFFCLLLSEGTLLHLHHFPKIKSKSQNSRNQGFSCFFCLMIEGSGSRAGSGSIPLTNGSGSRRPKTHVDPVDLDPDSDPDPQHCLPPIPGQVCNL